MGDICDRRSHLYTDASRPFGRAESPPLQNHLTIFPPKNTWHETEVHMTPKKRIPLGESDFKSLITNNSYFVDKSLFIKDVEIGSKVLLFARPRRFGKTLNLSMLKYFYDIDEKNAELFNGLKITSEKEIMQKQGKHPVIYLTLSGAKFDTLEQTFKSIYQVIYGLVFSFKDLLTSEIVSKIDTDCCQNILSKTADSVDFANSLKTLSHVLYHCHGTNPVILIDEYDTPIHEAYANGFYKEIINFMRVFLGGALKDNEYLEKAVLTGILRVSKESMFSGLNNITVGSVTSRIAGDKFGFTEDEVAEMLHHYDDIFSLADVKYWYDGYNFGGAEIYNPWSILHCIVQNQLSTHWVNTSTNDLVKELCATAGSEVKQDLDILTQGGSIQKKIDDNIVFANLGNDDNALWSFFLHSGYLRYDNSYVDQEDGAVIADLSIPNMEVSSLYKQDIVKNWFKPRAKTRDSLTKLMDNLISGDVNMFKDEFIEYCMNALSYYDVGGDEPEKVYHMFVLGMLFCLKDRYHIVSNRESGLGRCDVMMIPRGVRSEGRGWRMEDCRDGINAVRDRGIIFEFKKVDKDKRETFEDAIEDAKEQITDRRYAQELLSRGCKEIVNVAVAFAGKELRVEVYQG